MRGEKMRFRSGGLQTASSDRHPPEVDFVAATFRWAYLTWHLLRLERAATNTKSMLQNSRRRGSSRQKLSYVAQDFQHHRVRQLASKCILLARMIRREQARQIAWQFIASAMSKRKLSQRRNKPALFQQSQISPHRDATKHQHRTRPQYRKLALQKVPAICQLPRQRFVRRRRATQSRGHVSIVQSEPIFAIRRSGLIGEPRAKQRLVQEITRAVAREHAPRAIRSMRCRCKAQNQKLRARIAKARNRLAPIIPSEKRTTLVSRDLFAIPYEPRTRAAVNDFLIELFQFVQAALPLKSYHEPGRASQASNEHVAKSCSAARRHHAAQTRVVCARSRGNSSAHKPSELMDLDA
jgi:hypothetical protein